MSDSPKLGAVAVVLHENLVLLVKRKKNPNAGLWGFPGGHVELGETGLECAVRELYEETSVVAEPIRYLTNIDLIHQADDGSVAFHYLLAVVHCRYQKGHPVAGDDAADAAWFSIPDVLSNTLKVTEGVREITQILIREHPQNN